MKTLGEALKEIRINKNLSLDQAAKKIGITRQYLSMIEKGSRHSPSFENIIAISDVYEISLDQLKEYAKMRKRLVNIGVSSREKLHVR